MDEQIMGPFSVHASGNIGQVIRGPDGQIVAWTTDAWIAQVICGLLIENEQLFFTKKEDRDGIEVHA